MAHSALVAQSVRAAACQAAGHEFESRLMLTRSNSLTVKAAVLYAADSWFESKLDYTVLWRNGSVAPS